ncbi:hypothetical protein MJO28_012859 [Puccinia striiformis f. sp. tritici]|uniref:Protein YIF1 n=2 Tax=Puccinia striiformis TaxID=27350 RepID=A0A2S4VIJ8_9BASI|nr:hypothetical protein MJO28_012859 [Puccinia striiformis f. sp. tritici]POW09362.1 hypothetical protein PSHT_09163 [Puccinia striiformis]
MFNRNTQQSGPTLQHPKPVPPPFNLPASPPIPDTQSFSSNPYSSNSNERIRTSTASSSDYQRFSSPPAVPHELGDQQPFYQNQYQQNSPPNPLHQHQQHHQHQQQQHNQWQNPGIGQPNNNFASSNPFGVNDMTAQMGMQFGQSAMKAGSEYLTRYLPLRHLKHSFNVSNLYVFNKIKIILFPWRHKPWSRLISRSEVTGQVEGYQPPRSDLNCPDAYIPVMALMTYILLSGAVAGSKGRFDPELLSIAASQALGIIFLEFCCIKLGCYLLNIQGDGAVIDLVAYSGYKFVGIIVSLLASLAGLRSSICWAIFVYVFGANAFFLLRSLRYVILPDPSGQSFGASPTTTSSTVNSTQKSRRVQFLFAISVSQLASMWLLSRV